MRRILAIDPGASGGVAWIDADGLAHCRKMPDTPGDVLALLITIKTQVLCNVAAVCVLEEVGGFVGKGQPGSSMFKFGRGFGFLEGALMALGYRVELAKPQKWQKVFSLGTASACENKTQWKNKLKSEAQRRFPYCDVTLATSDALLILEYGSKEL